MNNIQFRHMIIVYQRIENNDNTNQIHRFLIENSQVPTN